MSDDSVDARPLTSVELLDAAVWREIGSEEAQPAAAFLDALSRLERPRRAALPLTRSHARPQHPGARRW